MRRGSTLIFYYRLGCRYLNTWIGDPLADSVKELYSFHSEKYPLNHSQYEVLLHQIKEGEYELSPIRVHNVKKVEFDDNYCCQISHFCFIPSRLPGYITVVKVDDKDLLVIDALTQLLLSVSLYGYGKRTGCDFHDYFEEFRNKVQKMSGISRLYRMIIHVPLPKQFILDKLPMYNVEKDTDLYDMIESFLNLPYVDDDGNDVSDQIGRPAVGKLSSALYNLVLQETFDLEFDQFFPGVEVYRYISLVLIGTKNQDQVVFNEKAGYALLMKLGMTGKIFSIGPGDDPLSWCDRKGLLCTVRDKGKKKPIGNWTQVRSIRKKQGQPQPQPQAHRSHQPAREGCPGEGIPIDRGTRGCQTQTLLPLLYRLPLNESGLEFPYENGAGEIGDLKLPYLTRTEGRSLGAFTRQPKNWKKMKRWE
ncbi:hypothetical protein E3N88_09732 [Mikania micrantha]|uniref:Uncharacterized protein n=1 Tax=Mikania micrantha TaxID=192012 RepID=A0A5N6PM58_9ASTR|nr:hypothetical protein E3N88_09732 [Mikania micrantha]